jgi:hypothetical protein
LSSFVARAVAVDVEATGERNEYTSAPVRGLWSETVGRGDEAVVDERRSSVSGAEAMAGL